VAHIPQRSGNAVLLCLKRTQVRQQKLLSLGRFRGADVEPAPLIERERIAIWMT
jgi:hypothetical protein